MNLQDSIKDKNDEEKNRKYKMFSVFYVYTIDGEFCEPFSIDLRTLEVVNIKNGQRIKVPSIEPQFIYDALRFLFNKPNNRSLSYAPSIRMVDKNTIDDQIFGKVFKPIRKEIAKYKDILSRFEILRGGEFKNIYASYNDLISLTTQIQGSIKKGFLNNSSDEFTF